MLNERIAIIGMSCRFPGANTLDEFWNNLCAGVDSVKPLSDEALKKAGVSEDLLKQEKYIKYAGKIENIESFDANFFGYSPAEAQIIDPQQRIFLEVAWHALEDAGYIPRRFKIPVGIFAGCSPNKYFLYHLFNQKIPLLENQNWEIDDFPIGSSADALTARLSYKLGLTGPSISVQTACSTSLVAVCLACESLLDFRCDLALAGGVSIQLPSQQGYFYQEGGMLSKSGRCRPFDASADGSVFGSGAGVIVLKRLAEAIEDKDNIYAVISGWSVRNDGANRAGYTTPGVEGQANVIVEAQIAAGLTPEHISYIETHGSATLVGDPIEIAGLTHAFNRNSDCLKKSCAIGSVKSNLGHLDVAAGIAGLIKTVLAVKNKIIPKTLHFQSSNPEINFDETPFYVQTITTPWTKSKPLHAGVSSFGLGGTNAHVILSEAPSLANENETKSLSQFLIFPISAKTHEALDKSTTNILQILENNTDIKFLNNAAYTLSVSRAEFLYRSIVFFSKKNMQKEILKNQVQEKKAAVFLFPGVGDQYQNSFRELFEAPGVFRDEMLYIAKAFETEIGLNFLNHLYPDLNLQATELPPKEGISLQKLLGYQENTIEEDALKNTIFAQIICFAIEYSLARQLIFWGVTPSALLGHSIGEYVAATIAGAINLDDAIKLVSVRASAIDALPNGVMLAIPLDIKTLTPYLEGVSISAINSTKLTIVSGTTVTIETLQKKLMQNDIVSQKLRVSHPFHSEHLRPAAVLLLKQASKIKFSRPKIPYISNVTGTWITYDEICSPEYWGNHLCKTVQFELGMRELLRKNYSLFVEVGPGQTLSTYTKDIASEINANIKTIQTGSSYFETNEAVTFLKKAIAKVWLFGGPVTWKSFYAENFYRVSLPGYPFDSKKYWIEKRLDKKNDSSISIDLNNLESNVLTTSETDLYQPNTPSLEQRPDIGIPYVPPRNNIEKKITQIWQELFGYKEIGINDDFVALGGHSLLALQFASKLWRLHKVEIPITIFLSNSTVAKLAKHLESKFNQAPEANVKAQNNIESRDLTFSILEKYILNFFNKILKRNLTIDSLLEENELIYSIPELINVLKREFGFRLYPNELIKYKNLRQIIIYLTEEISAIRVKKTSQNNQIKYSRPIIFILSSVRSGSTLLRVMLAGHPQLFCPPELHLLTYSTMKERGDKDKSPDQNQGLERALIEALNIDLLEAKNRIQNMLNNNLNTAEVLNILAESVEPRLLIEKSPGNANNILTLHKIHEYFPNAKFIYLMRHPYAVIDSIIKNRFTKLMEAGSIDPQDFGEFAWSRSNSNIIDFLELLTADKFISIKYENLVTNPITVMQGLCNFLNITFTDTLLTPYTGRRMRDGLGDPNFLEHDKIDANLGNIWKSIKLSKPISRSCRSLAASLEYELL